MGLSLILKSTGGGNDNLRNVCFSQEHMGLNLSNLDECHLWCATAKVGDDVAAGV